MNEENFKIEGTEMPSMEENDLTIIEKILEKYGLVKVEKEGIEKIVESFASPIISPEERIKIFENLPGTKISTMIKEYTEGKLTLENFPLRLEQDLNISKREAEQITKELEKVLFASVKSLEGKISPPGETIRQKTETPVTQKKKLTTFPKKDAYRETLE